MHSCLNRWYRGPQGQSSCLHVWTFLYFYYFPEMVKCEQFNVLRTKEELAHKAVGTFSVISITFLTLVKVRCHRFARWSLLNVLTSLLCMRSAASKKEPIWTESAPMPVTFKKDWV